MRRKKAIENLIEAGKTPERPRVYICTSGRGKRAQVWKMHDTGSTDLLYELHVIASQLMSLNGARGSRSSCSWTTRGSPAVPMR